MTNILATVLVSIVTNSTDQIYTPPLAVYGCLVNGCPTDHFREAQEQQKAKQVKTITTTCKEITVLKFDWHGPQQIVAEKILWQTNQVLKLDWR